MKYNHFEYCEALARKLKPVGHTDEDRHFFRATEDTSPKELYNRISSSHGMIMIAIDGKDESYIWPESDSLMVKPVYSLVIAKQTQATDSDTIFIAQRESHMVMRQCIAKILQDAAKYKSGCEFIDAGSFVIEGAGPLGDLFYGVIMTFTLDYGIEYKLNPEMWL
jgi:hypothetical protein